ncbi:O83 family O-antigen flippase [Aliiglaciecola litoralis]|uniref:O83 family O-antigen flippase n=1 Tax=Aliiglaciecola litoralis TaxID=582857 RepID=A0ABP3WMW5_9ALTE
MNTFGKLAIALFLLDIFFVFSTVGFNAYLLKTKEFTSAKANSSFTASFILVCIFIALIVASNYVFSHEYQGTQTHYLLALCPILIINSFSIVADSKIQREFNYHIIAKITVASSFISGISAVMFAVYGFEEWSIIFGRLIHSFLLSTLLVINAQFLPRFRIDKYELKEMYTFIKPLFLSQFLTFTTDRANQIMVASFLGANFFALLSLAKRPYMEIQHLTLGQINKVLVNTLSRSQDNHATVCYRLASLVAVFIIPIFLGLSAISDVFLVGILGSKWQESVLLMSLFGFEVLALVFAWFMNSFFIANGQPQLIYKVVKVGFLIRVLASLIAVQYGILYLVLTNIAVSFIMIPIHYFYFARVVNVSFFILFKSLYPAIVAGLIMFGVVSFYLSFFTQYLTNPYLLLISAIMAGSVIYISTFYFMFPKSFKMTVNEIRTLTKG